jgi:hypothetical protein
MLGFIFEHEDETSEYLFNVRNSIRIMGLSVLPFVALIAWTPYILPVYLFTGGFMLLAILYLLLLWRGVIIFLKKHFSVFYLFLYLCTLEIIPLLIAVKLLAG